jgi:hypothetical protein
MRISNSRVLRKIFGHKREEVNRRMERIFLMRSFIVYYVHHVIIKVIKSR